eukprot:scaffold164_cov409-Prasinococcus_capsulatus_cf.AAC.5
MQVGEGDVVRLGNLSAKVYDMPGHTLGHIVYHFESEQKAFVGRCRLARLGASSTPGAESAGH